MLNIQITLENPSAKELSALIAFGVKLTEPTEEVPEEAEVEATVPTLIESQEEEPAKPVEPKKRTRKPVAVESVLAESETYSHEGSGDLAEKTPFPSEVVFNGLSEDAFDSLYQKEKPATLDEIFKPVNLDEVFKPEAAAEVKAPVKLMTLFEIRDYVKARPEANKTEILQEILASLDEKNLNAAIANPEKHEALCRALYSKFND